MCCPALVSSAAASAALVELRTCGAPLRCLAQQQSREVAGRRERQGTAGFPHPTLLPDPPIAHSLPATCASDCPQAMVEAHHQGASPYPPPPSKPTGKAPSPREAATALKAPAAEATHRVSCSSACVGADYSLSPGGFQCVWAHMWCVHQPGSSCAGYGRLAMLVCRCTHMPARNRQLGIRRYASSCFHAVFKPCAGPHPS